MHGKRHAQEPSDSPSKRTAGADRYPDSTCNSLKLVIQKTKAALDDSRFDEAIFQSSAAINELVRLLELRACAYSKTANVNQELKDALLVTQLTPEYYGGYLHAGRLLSLQGYQDEAMRLLREGLDRIPQTDSNQYLLQQEYEEAKVRSHQRVDYIAKLSFEIAACIITQLPRDNLFELTRVSKAWRMRVLGNPSCWEDLVVKLGLRSNCLLPEVSRHITKLCLEDDLELITKSLNLIQADSFSKLCSLSIAETPSAIGANTHMFYNDICSVLSAVFPTLTHLRIQHSKIKIPALAAILLICRNLTKLELNGPPNSSWLNGLSLPFNVSLTHLTLHAYEEESDDVNQLGQLLRCSPALKYLELNDFSLDILSAIAEYCPNLTHLVFNRFYFDGFELVEGPESPAAGHFLAVGGSFSMRLILPLIEAYHNTLTTLYLSPTDEALEHGWEALSNFSLPSLTKLSIWDDSEIHMFVAPLIRSSPSLKEITLRELEDGITANIVSAISQLKHIEYLAIQQCTFEEARLAQMLSNCRLRKLVLEESPSLTEELLTAITTILSLECLEISAFEDVRFSRAEGFMEALAKLPFLREIFLRFFDVSDAAIRSICASKSLTKIRFESCTVSDEGMRLLADHGIQHALTHD